MAIPALCVVSQTFIEHLRKFNHASKRRYVSLGTGQRNRQQIAKWKMLQNMKWNLTFLPPFQNVTLALSIISGFGAKMALNFGTLLDI